MTNEIKGGGSHELSTDINVITAEINAYQRVAGEAIFEIGRRLKWVRDSKTDGIDPEEIKIAKERELAGGWIRWLTSVDIDRRRSAEFIKVFEEFTQEDVRTYGHFGLNAMAILATISESEREQSHTIPSTGATKTVDEMTVRELREVKAELKKTQEERDAERKQREQAESQAKVAQRSEDIMRRQLDEVEGREQEIEVRTEYIEVADIDAERKLRRYEELFGDVSMYDGQTTRVTNGDAITYAVFEFTQDVRKFIEKYGHLTHFATEFSAMIDEGKDEYRAAINDMHRFMAAVERSMDAGKTTILNG